MPCSCSKKVNASAKISAPQCIWWFKVCACWCAIRLCFAINQFEIISRWLIRSTVYTSNMSNHIERDVWCFRSTSQCVNSNQFNHGNNQMSGFDSQQLVGRCFLVLYFFKKKKTNFIHSFNPFKLVDRIPCDFEAVFSKWRQFEHLCKLFVSYFFRKMRQFVQKTNESENAVQNFAVFW